MTEMIDVDGVNIPLNGGYAPFNLTLFSDGKVSMRVPAFATDSGEYTPHGGVVEVSLCNLFDEYLANENLLNIPSEPIHVANLLREYATKFEAFSKAVASTEPLSGPSAQDIHDFEVAAAMVGRKLTLSLDH